MDGETIAALVFMSPFAIGIASGTYQAVKETRSHRQFMQENRHHVLELWHELFGDGPESSPLYKWSDEQQEFVEQDVQMAAYHLLRWDERPSSVVRELANKIGCTDRYLTWDEQAMVVVARHGLLRTLRELDAAEREHRVTSVQKMRSDLRDQERRIERMERELGL